METLYLPSSEYNTELIVVELARIFKEKGGVLCWSESNKKPISHKENSEIPKRMIVNSYLIEKKHKLAETLRKANKLDKKVPYIEEVEEEYRKITSLDNTPVITYGKYFSVVLDGVYYNFCFDDNPLFGIHFAKAKVTDYLTFQNCYSDNSMHIVYDVVWKFSCTQEQRKEIAEELFEEAMKAKYSEKYGNKTMYIHLYKEEENNEQAE